MPKGLYGNLVKGLLFMVVLIFSNCASLNNIEKMTNDKLNQDISKGLPETGLWRQNIVLYDIDKDGLDEIITPPPRKAPDDKRRPHVFKWNKGKDSWEEIIYKFEKSEDYNYGGISIADIDNNGLFDIVLANHERKVTLLKNLGNDSFSVTYPFSSIDFMSRTVLLEDINKDGLIDVICLSEFTMSDRPNFKKGIFVAINQGTSFKNIQLDESDNIFGDSFAIGDINGDGNKDIIISAYTNLKEYKKFIWLGDGRGNFKYFPTNFIGDKEITMSVRTADIDGDGIDEIIYLISSVGDHKNVFIKVFKLVNNEMKELSQGLEDIKVPYVFDVMIDEDRKALLGALGEEGFSLYKFDNTKWSKINEIKMTKDDTIGVYDIKMSRQKADGSLLIVYILGNEQFEKKGIKAFKIKK